MRTSPRHSGYLTLSRVVPFLVIFVCLSHAYGAIDWRTYTPPVTPIEIKDDGIAQQFYVAPTGDDALDGLAPVKSGSSGAFATLDHACDTIRKLHQERRLPEQNPWKPADTNKHFST